MRTHIGRAQTTLLLRAKTDAAALPGPSPPLYACCYYLNCLFLFSFCVTSHAAGG